MTEAPRRTATIRMTQRPNATNFTLNRIANNLYKIRHWDIRHASYESLENKQATWFIDPPYQFGGHSYRCSNKKIDFVKLAEWCKERNGQVMVCETTKATWMDFRPMTSHKTRTGMQKEAVWMSESSSIGLSQLALF
jgi:16S rRNA G966 N2-methylase RsmD